MLDLVDEMNVQDLNNTTRYSLSYNQSYTYEDITVHMVPTVKEIIFSKTFPGQNYHFPGQSIQSLKVITQYMCEKAYHIYLINV